MSNSKASLTINNKPITAKKIAEELNLAADELLESAAIELENRLNALIRNLNRRSTRRGRGAKANEYNQPFKNAVVKVERKKGKILVSVDHKVFNILDQGRKEHEAKNNYKFPEYKGNLTKADSATLNREKVEVAGRPVWRTIRKGATVSAIEPRNFYKNLLDKITFTKRRRKAGKSIFVFPFDPRFIEFEVVKDGT